MGTINPLKVSTENEETTRKGLPKTAKEITMSRYGVDWSQNPEKLVIFTDGKGVKPVRIKWESDFFSWIKTLKSGDTILVEAPFEPYHHKIRNDIINFCKANGINLLTINPRETANKRIELGVVAQSEEDTLDIADAKIIFDFLKKGIKHFPKAKPAEEKPLTWKDEVNMDRRNGWKESLKLYSYLPTSAPSEHLDSLTNGGKYADGFVLPVLRAAIHVKSEGGNREQFEKYVGSYGAGYPSYIRATFYRRVRTLDQRSLGIRSFKKAGVQIVRDYPELHKENMKKVRKATRWIFSQAKV